MKTKSIFKKVSFALLMLFSITLINQSCDEEDLGLGSGGGIQAKVDGKTVKTVSIATFATKVTGGLIIQGNTAGTTSEAFTLQILGFNGAGTYKIGGGANITVSASYLVTKVDLLNPLDTEVTTWQAPYDESVAGEIIVTEIDDSRVKGTFIFKAKNTAGDGSIVNITDGLFDVKLQ